MFKLYLLLSLSTIAGLSARESKTLLQNRLQGAVVGAAIGDALGKATLRFDTTTDLKNSYGEEGVGSFTAFKKQDWSRDAKGNEAALYSANTALAREAFAVLHAGRNSAATPQQLADQAALSLVKQFETEKLPKDALFDFRNHTLANVLAAERLAAITDKQTAGWSCRKNKDKKFDDEVAKESDSSALARVWPTGLVFADDLSKVKKISEEITSITHRHPAARAASAAMAVGVAYALRGASVDEVVNEMVKAAEQYDSAEKIYKCEANKIRALKCFNSKAVRANRDLISKNQMLTSDMIRYAAQAARLDIESEVVFGATNKKQENNRSFRGYLLGYEADEAVAAAVYFFVKNPVSVQAAVSQAANIPGNGALVGSLSGALIGARTGYDVLDNCGLNYELKWLENRSELISAANELHGSMKDFVVNELSSEEMQACMRSSSWSTLSKVAFVAGTVGIGYLAYKLYQHYYAAPQA